MARTNSLPTTSLAAICPTLVPAWREPRGLQPATVPSPAESERWRGQALVAWMRTASVRRTGTAVAQGSSAVVSEGCLLGGSGRAATPIWTPGGFTGTR